MTMPNADRRHGQCTASEFRIAWPSWSTKTAAGDLFLREGSGGSVRQGGTVRAVGFVEKKTATASKDNKSEKGDNESDRAARRGVRCLMVKRSGFCV